MKKVLITGAGGFIGSHLTEKCVELGYEVRAFIRYNSKNHWGWLENSSYKDDLEITAGDIRDFDSVFKAMQGVDTVYHLAALIGIPYSYVSPLAYIRTNIEGTYNILQSAKELGTQNVLITSTSETYGTAQYVPIDEAHPLVGQSPYSASKIGADQMAIGYYRSFEMPIKIIRPFNTYGPRQSARAFIPNIITQILNNQKQIKVGNLSPTRDLTFVEDTADGFVAIAESNRRYGKVTNIGMGAEISMQQLAEKICDLMKSQTTLVSDSDRIRPSHSEVDRLFCKNQELLQSTDWNPQFTLTTGLEKTIAWFKDNKELYKPELYNV